MEEKYKRVVSSSLLGYAWYLQKVSIDHIQSKIDANKRLTSSAKFWKLAQHKDCLIRSGFFTCLIAICQHATFLIQDDVPRLTATIFGRLSENDPIVLSVVWDALLHAVTALPVSITDILGYVFAVEAHVRIAAFCIEYEMILRFLV